MSRHSTMTSLASSLFGSIGARRTGGPSKRRRTSFRPEVGTLEERVVQTVLFNPVFGAESVIPSSNPSGLYTVLNHPAVDVIFWGAAVPVASPLGSSVTMVNYWSTAKGQAEAAAFTNDVKTILNGPYLSGLTQYGSDGTAVWGGSWTDPATTPPAGMNPGDSRNAMTIQQEIQHAIDTPGSGIPAPGSASPIYVVVTSPNSSGTNNGGFNFPGTYNGTPINMVSLGVSANDNGARMLTFSHELVEDMTDPTGDRFGVQVIPPPGLPASVFSGVGQVADGEPEPPGQAHYSYTLNGVRVQPYWSRSDNAFIVPDSPWTAGQRKTYMGPVWANPTTANPTFTGNYLAFSTEVKDSAGHVFGLLPATGEVDELVNGSWVSVNSGITSLVCDYFGNVFALNPTGAGNVYEHNLNTGASWTTVDSGITSMVSDFMGNVYVLNPTGQGIVSEHYLNTGASWYAVGSGITSLVSDASGNVYAFNPTGAGYVYEHKLDGTGWTIAGSGFTSLVGDATGNVFALNPTGSGYVYEHNLDTGVGWTVVGSNILKLVGDATGNVFALDPVLRYVYEHNLNTGASWTTVGSGVTSLVSDTTGNVFALNPVLGNVYEHTLNTGVNWTVVEGNISILVSDTTGNVYALDHFTGNIYEHIVNTGAGWFTVGGGISSLVSDTTGNVYALNPYSGNVYEHVVGTGASWFIMGGGISSLVSDATGNVYALNSSTGTVYEHIVGTGASWFVIDTGITSMVSDVSGNVYVVNTSGVRYRHVLSTGWNWVLA
jgi:hypothetical protein